MSTTSARPLILGASGFIGRALAAHFGPRALGTYASRALPGLEHFDALANDMHSRLAALKERHEATHAVLLFGDTDPISCHENRDATRALNVDAMQRVILAAAECGMTPVYFSTDYVFEGARGNYDETDEPNPGTEYGRQKLAVERWLENEPFSALVVRTAKVYDTDPAGGSILPTMARQILEGSGSSPFASIPCAHDQQFTPTHAADLARGLELLMDAGETGIWHVCGPERTARADLLRTVAGTLGRLVRVEERSIHSFGLPEPWPENTTLSTKKFDARFGMQKTTFAEAAQNLAHLLTQERA